MSSQWYYEKNGEKRGPFTADELRSHASQGQFAPTDLVHRDGMEKPIPASKVKGLFPAPEKISPLPKPAEAAASGTPSDNDQRGRSNFRMELSSFLQQLSEAAVNRTSKLKKFWDGSSKKAKVFAICGIAFLGLLFIGFLSNNGKIKAVRNLRPGASPNVTIGEVLDAVCKNPKWEHTYAKKKDQNGEYTIRVEVVRFKGDTKRGPIILQYIVQGKEPEFHWADLDGSLLSPIETAAFFNASLNLWKCAL